MGNRHLIYYLVLFTFSLFIVLHPGNRSLAASHLTDKQWKELTKDKAFGYSKEKELKEEKKPPVSENFFSMLIGGLIAFFGTSLGKTLVWVVLFSVIAWAVFKIIVNEKSSFFRRKPEPVEEEVDLSDIQPEDLLLTNWEEHIARARKEGNTRLIIRYSYMMLLQILQRKQLIHYRSDKTNYDYYYELGNTSYKQPFRQLTRQYEYAWYGNYPTAPETLTEYMQTLDNLKTQISRS